VRLLLLLLLLLLLVSLHLLMLLLRLVRRRVPGGGGRAKQSAERARGGSGVLLRGAASLALLGLGGTRALLGRDARELLEQGDAYLLVVLGGRGGDSVFVQIGKEGVVCARSARSMPSSAT